MPAFPILITGPKGTRSAREHHLEMSRARSHSATVSHRAKKAQPSASVCAIPSRPAYIEENETLDFQTPFLEHLKCFGQRVSRQTQHRKKKQLGVKRIHNRNNGFLVSAPWTDTFLSANPDIREGRSSLQFFIERTAVECSGWYDREFWTSLVPQAAESHPTLKYGMIALGAYHQSLEACSKIDKAALRALCVKNGNKALESLRDNYDNMSFAAILCCYVALTEFAAVLGQYAILQALKSQFAIIDDLRNQQAQRQIQIATRESDEHYIFTYLAPLVEKQRSRVGHIVDPMHLLRVTPSHYFYVPELYIPKVFESLWQARQSLELLLDWTIYAVKTRSLNEVQLPQESETWLEQWSARLQKFKNSHIVSQKDYCSFRILMTTSKLCFMMIQNMFTEDEMVFDQYEDLYQDFASAASIALATEEEESTSPAKIRFGIDSGLISLVGWTARRWCRDPTIRRQLIDLLFSVQRREGLESSLAWSRVCRWVQRQEESGIIPPPQRASDIPREKRVRINQARFHFARKLYSLEVLRYPYDGSNTTVVWQSAVPGIHVGPLQSPNAEEQSSPDLILGKGFSCFLKDGRMQMIEAHRFTYPIPRT